MSENLNNNDNFSESKLLDFESYIQDEIKKNNIDIHNDEIIDDESIDDESPEVGWNSDDEKKYYNSLNFHIEKLNVIEEEKNEEYDHEEENEISNLNVIEEKNDFHLDEIKEEVKETNDESNKSSNKTSFLGLIYTYVCNIISNFEKPNSK